MCIFLDVEKMRQKYEEDLKVCVVENERKIADLQKTFEEKLKQAEKEKGVRIYYLLSLERKG